MSERPWPYQGGSDGTAGGQPAGTDQGGGAPAGGAPAGGQPQGGQGDFLASLPDDLRSDGSLKNFNGPDGGVKLAKSFTELNRAFSARRMEDGQPPTDDAGRKAVLSKLGHAPPDTPDGYELPDSDAARSFRDQAHKLGLTNQQAKDLFGSLEQQRSESSRRTQERLTQLKTEGEAALRGEWGDKFDAEMATAQRGLEGFLPEDVRQGLEATGLIHHPAVAKLGNRLGRAMQEGTMHAGSGPGAGSGAASLEAAQAERSKYFEANQKFILSQNDTIPDVRRAKAEYQRLNQQVARFKLQSEQAQTSGQAPGAGQ